MQKIFLTVLISIIIFSCKRNQPLNLNQFYAKYANEGSVDIKLPMFLARMVAKDPETRKLAKMVRASRIMIIEKDNLSNGKQVRTDLMRAMQDNRYEDLLSVVSSTDFVSIKAREQNNKINHLIIAVDGQEETVLLDLKTNASMQEIMDLIHGMKNDEGQLDKDKIKFSL